MTKSPHYEILQQIADEAKVNERYWDLLDFVQHHDPARLRRECEDLLASVSGTLEGER